MSHINLSIQTTCFVQLMLNKTFFETQIFSLLSSEAEEKTNK